MRMERLTGSRVRGVVCFLAVCCMLAAAEVAATDYLGPVDVVASTDGERLFVANADAKQIAVVDLASGKVTRKIAMPAEPTGMILGPKGTKLYVTCAAPKSTIVVLDAASGETIASIPTGHTAIGPAITPDGKMLYACNRFDNEVVVIDLATGQETARVPATREPIAAAITPNGKTVFVANHLSADSADAEDVAAVVTMIDAASLKTTSIRLPNGSSSLRDVCISPDGRYAFVVHILARYYLPYTSLELIWRNANAMSVIDVAEEKRLNTLLLDDIDLGAANPWGVACSTDGASICITHAGSHELSVIDAKAMIKKLRAMPDKAPVTRPPYRAATADEVPNDRTFLMGLRRRIHLRDGDPRKPSDPNSNNGPRGLAIIGSKAYVVTYFSDGLAVVDLAPKADKAPATIHLGFIRLKRMLT